MTRWNEYISENKDRFLEELTQLLSIPSISNDEGRKAQMQACAGKLIELMMQAGFDAAIIEETSHHPVVFGKKIINPDLPTVLVYGHYDVQPPDPVDLWHHDPFDPQVVDGRIVARGASDDKGQMFMHIKALEVMARTGTLPCNMKMIIEGEEEIGSPSLPEYLNNHKELLKADIILASDTAMISMEHPSIETALRGMAYMEIALAGPNRDLHSGVYGGAVANPINMLCKMIASMHDENNHITIPGFYDKVIELSKQQRHEIAKLPFDEMEYKEELGIKAVWGEKGYTTLERTGIRPTLDVNGIWGGYTGEGAKTVLPSKAFAKVSMRLVPDQQPEEIADLFKAYLQQQCPPGVTVDVKYLHGGKPVITDTKTAGYQAAVKAIKATFSKEPLQVYSGGSIPIVALFKEILGLDTVLMGFGLDNDNIHSPNEKFDLVNFYKGVETIPFFYKYFTEKRS
ncbi:dipeptidase [Parafilimonas sp.]|uniref:dipeptidase n=1 Tax=Parafilimonas sp. TaxID=1969739 RepID=UPI003F801D60